MRIAYAQIGDNPTLAPPPTDGSDTPTADEVAQFETAHKSLFITLAFANNLYINLFEQGLNAFLASGASGNYTDSPEYTPVQQLGQMVAVKAGKWFDVQNYLEANTNIAKCAVTDNDILIPASNIAVMNQANMYLDGGSIQGVGFVPLLIWAVIVIAAAISASYIVYRLTDTNQDKTDLLNQITATSKALNLTPTQVQGLATTIFGAPNKTSSNFADIFKSINKTALIIGTVILIPILVKLIPKKSNAAT